MKDDDQIIRQRIDGRSVGKDTLALELARLDELQEVFYARALDGYAQCAALNRATLCNFADRR
jgi:hypothetical protein